MRLRLKEEPNEWRRFALVAAAAAALLSALACRRGILPFNPWRLVLGAIALLLVVALWRPRLVRPVYRTAMTLSFHAGQVVGRLLLTLVFIFVVTPLGWGLRRCGKDLLRLRRDPAASSYWRPAAPRGRLEHSF